MRLEEANILPRQNWKRRTNGNVTPFAEMGNLKWEMGKRRLKTGIGKIWDGRRFKTGIRKIWEEGGLKLELEKFGWKEV